MASELGAAWRRSCLRLDQASSFIDDTISIEKIAREQVYASRVLLLYGACQYSIQELGSSAVKTLSGRVRTPTSLPVRVLREHVEGAMRKVGLEASTFEWEEARAVLTGLTGSNWAEYTGLHHLEGNVWPDRIVSYCRRFSDAEPDFGWFRDVITQSGETLESRLRTLVQERNPIAHGHIESNVLSAELMKEWVEDCRSFIERVYKTVAISLFKDLPKRPARVGRRDRSVILGNQTVALSEMFEDMRVGDFVILRAKGSDEPRAASVESIMSNGERLDFVRAGDTRVAVGLSRGVGRCELYGSP